MRFSDARFGRTGPEGTTEVHVRLFPTVSKAHPSDFIKLEMTCPVRLGYVTEPPPDLIAREKHRLILARLSVSTRAQLFDYLTRTYCVFNLMDYFYLNRPMPMETYEDFWKYIKGRISPLVTELDIAERIGLTLSQLEEFKKHNNGDMRLLYHLCRENIFDSPDMSGFVIPPYIPNTFPPPADGLCIMADSVVGYHSYQQDKEAIGWIVDDFSDAGEHLHLIARANIQLAKYNAAWEAVREPRELKGADRIVYHNMGFR